MPPVEINQTNIPQTESVKYLGIHFDRRLTWKDHVQTERKQLEHKTREIKWLIGRLSLPTIAGKQNHHQQNSPQTSMSVWY